MKLSVVICTHNPRPDYLRRVLDALKAQTLSLEQWELLLMDNASKERLADIWDLSWHPHARHIREEKLGKTHALLTAIREAKGSLLMTVDDDNVLRSDFLENTVKISTEFPFLGAWGASVEGEFEHEIPDWLKPHLLALAVRKVDRDYWSNYYADSRSMPVGAGLCVRKLVAEAYARALISRPASMELDRKGTSLVSGGDIDLAMTAYDSGFGTAVFNRLHITHIIPKARMTVDYLCRLLEGIEYSTHLLKNQRNPGYTPPQEDSKLRRWLRAYQVWRLPEPTRSFVKAENLGLARATVEIAAKS
jgi:glycosyltransferase involved in cell wall biosynthesis